MVHLSEVLGVPVIGADGTRLGRLDDLLVDTMLNRVDRVVVRRRRQLVSYPWSAVDAFAPENRRVTLEAQAEALAFTPPEEHPARQVPGEETPAEGAPAGPGEVESILLRRDVLDRQIIDIQGRKVVRVNDILLDTTGGDLAVRRVEVGLAGAVRRLLAGLISPRHVRQVAAGLSEQGIPWDFVGLVEPRSASIRLKVHQQLARMHPADLADIIEDLGRVERERIVSQMDPEVAAEALSEAEPEVQASVVEAMHTEQAADLLEEMQPDEAADILGDLPAARSRELLNAMEQDEAEDVRELLAYHENTAGGLMTTEFFTARSQWTVAETLSKLREIDEDLVGELDEIPIVAEGERLVGVAPLVRLIRAPGGDAVTSVMRREARAVTPATPFDEVVERFEKYHLRALAVADEFGMLVGLISIEDVFSRLVGED